MTILEKIQAIRYTDHFGKIKYISMNKGEIASLLIELPRSFIPASDDPDNLVGKEVYGFKIMLDEEIHHLDKELKDE